MSRTAVVKNNPVMTGNSKVVSKWEFEDFDPEEVDDLASIKVTKADPEYDGVEVKNLQDFIVKVVGGKGNRTYEWADGGSTYPPADVQGLIDAARGKVKKEEPDEFDLMADGEIAKTDPAQQIVFGWAYVTHDTEGAVNIDKSGDFIDQVEEIEKSAYDFVLNSRASDADHTNVKGGTLVESIVFTPEKIEKMGIPPGTVPNGWWLGFKIEDKATWERVEKGELTAFSIHGSGVRSKVEED